VNAPSTTFDLKHRSRALTEGPERAAARAYLHGIGFDEEALAKPIRDTAWRAQERLCRRYRKLARAGKLPTVITAAIARELSGFVWAIAKQAQPAA